MPVVNINDITLHYEEKGTGNDQVLILIHPPVLPGEVFRPQLDELSKHFHVLVPDLRGHGNSSTGTEKWNFTNISKELNWFMGELGIEKAWFCGYSAGGSITFEFALRYPDKLNGLIQVGPVSRVNDPLLGGTVRGGIQLAKTSVFTLALFGSIINTNKLRVFKRLFKSARKSDAHDSENYYKSYLHYDCTNDLPDITVPVLLVYGDRDILCGRYSKQLYRLLPDSQLVSISNIGHEIPSRRSVELNGIIKSFIKQQESRSNEWKQD